MNEFAGSLEERAEERVEGRVETHRVRYLAIEALGPLTILAGIVWAIAQPYRIVFLRDGAVSDETRTDAANVRTKIEALVGV